jgi:methionyl-tRNA synthetase
MTSSPRKILVTCALIYANGSIHLGHLVEYIQADIWVRFQRMREQECIYICGNDTHGTPIMLTAKQRGMTPEELIAEIFQEHIKDFADFYVEFDNFYTTHSEESRELTELFYQRLKAHDDIAIRNISQAYDPKEQMFLPDRYVKGECPRCGASDQYGDNCEVCGATYSPLDLKNPISVISGIPPVQKESEHYFFLLSKHTKFLEDWLQPKSGHVQPEVANKLAEWFKEGLQDLDISRDAPYFGFKIPGTDAKYFYVWLDAPIGYMAILKNLCARNPKINFDEYWLKENATELYHFVGKDIINFHALFWPAMLHSAGFRTPTAVFTHGYLTIEGLKMSKSRGTFITAREYLNHLNPEYLRYYFAAKLNSHVEDIDLNLTDFMQRINSDLVGKVVNIASRCASFIHKYFDGKLSASKPIYAETLLKQFTDRSEGIAINYETREYSRAMRIIMELADHANHFIDNKKPWAEIKKEEQKQNVHEVCSLGLNLFRLLIIYLKPVLPETVKKAEGFLNIPPLTWADADINKILLDHTINPFTPLLQRITPEQIAALQNISNH